MKIRTLTLIIAAVMLIAVGVLVWPEPKMALATDLDAELTLDWGAEDPFHCGATAELLDSNQQPFNPPRVINLNPNAGFTVWTGTFLNVPSQASFVLFNWNPGLPPLNWEPFPVTVQLNWLGVTQGQSAVQ
ncbi:MAG: hypothetical protein FJY67_11945 [Calditrichaeota bacterium]|nr:hypothetical protein [Calditrichota bacterium]